MAEAFWMNPDWGEPDDGSRLGYKQPFWMHEPKRELPRIPDPIHNTIRCVAPPGSIAAIKAAAPHYYDGKVVIDTLYDRNRKLWLMRLEDGTSVSMPERISLAD